MYRFGGTAANAAEICKATSSDVTSRLASEKTSASAEPGSISDCSAGESDGLQEAGITARQNSSGLSAGAA